MIISGTAEELTIRRHTFSDSGLPIDYIPLDDSFPRFENGMLKNCRRIAGIYNYQIGEQSLWLEILPKGWQSNAEKGSVETWHRIFLRLYSAGLCSSLEDLTTQDLIQNGLNSSVEGVTPLESLLNYTFGVLEDALKKGAPFVRKEYEVISPTIRGNIDWPKQLSKLGPLKHIHSQRIKDLNFENEIYFFIRFAVESLANKHKYLCTSPNSQTRFRRISEKVQIFPIGKGPEYLRPAITNFLRYPPRRYLHLHSAVSLLAKWIYNFSFSEATDLKFSLEGFQINFDTIFEKWCRQFLSQCLSSAAKKTKVVCNEVAEHWYWGTESKKILKPDIVLFEKKSDCREVLVLADAKYKDLNSNQWWESTDESEISRNDFFQIYCYKHALQNFSFLEVKQPVRHRSKGVSPKLLIFYPSDEVRLDSPGFYGESETDWSLKVVGLPFNKFLRGEDLLVCEKELSEWLAELLDKRIKAA